MHCKYLCLKFEQMIEKINFLYSNWFSCHIIQKLFWGQCYSIVKNDYQLLALNDYVLRNYSTLFIGRVLMQRHII